MHKLRTADLVEAIAQLGTTQAYDYYTGNAKIRITDLMRPEGPISFQRWNTKTSPQEEPKSGGISIHQLETLAMVFSRRPDYPIHFDRLFSGGGNSRSALETLLALTPHFFICYPEKTNPYTGSTDNALKHLMWCPDDAHTLGQIVKKNYKQVISEVELDVDYGDIQLPPSALGEEFDSIEAKTVHTRMQVALARIGTALNFHTWVAKNDQSILIARTRLGDMENVIKSLDSVHILHTDESKRAASFIDCIWFSDDYKYIPSVIEIEHSTGVTSGLTRMLKLYQAIPSIKMSCTIVAPNELRYKVVTEANSDIFRPLRARFMPYSTVQELYGLILKYDLRNVVGRGFVEPFMEKVVEA